jgi:hypothetical protein
VLWLSWLVLNLQWRAEGKGEHGDAQPSAAQEPGGGCVTLGRLLVVPTQEVIVGFSERAKGIAVGHRELDCELLVACSSFCFVREK